jgi:hypothetical protein
MPWPLTGTCRGDEHREHAVMTEPARAPVQRPPAPAPGRESRLERFRRKRPAADQDRRSARLAELHLLKLLVADAVAVVEAGWVRDGWFAYVDEGGTPRLVGALSAHRMAGRPVVGACLVGAVVQAGGGLPAVRTQPVQRALELVWHTLYRDPDEPVRWCPAPPVRAAHVQDLTRWNDRRSRTAADVVTLLHDAADRADAEIRRLRT